MFNSKAGKIMIVFCIVLFVGLSVFAFLYTHGLSGIRTYPEYKEGQLKVACVGDSVTYGHSVSSWSKSNYPALLGSFLGDGYNVCNFGVSGSTVQDSGDQPYTKTKAYTSSKEYGADILVFMMGSNDSKPENWKGEEAFIESYNKLLDSYLQEDKKPSVYLCTVPTAFFPEGVASGLTNYDIQPEYVEAVADIIKEIAKERNLPVIDINALTENRRDLFGKDNVHPNNDGARAIAEEVLSAIR
ncbi:MAG: hypothetical protein IKB12_03930 [Clostridia bacterium]|nr:hypothetical protein [Clostridia bacterium]